MLNYSFSFIIPAYNEEKNINGAIDEVIGVVKKCNIKKYEIIVINDCSSDKTLQIVTARVVKNLPIKIINNLKNYGFGGSYKLGVQKAIMDYVIMIPGDNAHPGNGIIPILNLAGSADIIIPYSKNPGTRSLARRIISFLFTFFVNLLFLNKVPYYNGLVLHKTKLIQSIEIKTNSFAYQAEGLVRLLSSGASFISVGVDINERDHGKSSAFKLKNIFFVIKAVIFLRIELFFTFLKNQSYKKLL